MSNHQKRLSAPNSWPIERKTQTFTTKADAGPHGEAGVPLVVLLRDVLEYVDSRKEARYALAQDSVLVNGDAVSDEDRPIGMFDILAFRQREEYYRVFPGDGGRLSLTPIDEEDAGSKLGKIVDKSTVSGGQTQLNLHDGANLLVESEEYAGTDSIVVDNETSEIVAHFPYEEGALVTAVAGTHAGEVGTVEEIRTTLGSGSNAVRVATDAGEEFETIEEYVVVIDENFTSDEDATQDDSEDATASEADAEPDEDVEEAAAEAVEESADDDADEADDADDAEDAEVADDGGEEE
jgi:small subunit ribosomal protein S4e